LEGGSGRWMLCLGGGPSSKEPRTYIRPQHAWRVLLEPSSSSSSPGRFIGVVIKHAILFDYFAHLAMDRHWSIIPPSSLLSMLFNKDAFPDSPIQHSTLHLKHHCFHAHVDSLLAPITPPKSSRQHVFGVCPGVGVPERLTLPTDRIMGNVRGTTKMAGIVMDIGGTGLIL